MDNKSDSSEPIFPRENREYLFNSQASSKKGKIKLSTGTKLIEERRSGVPIELTNYPEITENEKLQSATVSHLNPSETIFKAKVEESQWDQFVTMLSLAKKTIGTWFSSWTHPLQDKHKKEAEELHKTIHYDPPKSP